VVVAAAWVLAIIAQVTGKGILLDHGILIQGRPPFFRPPPLWMALLLFCLAWQVMVIAMMLPSALPMLRLFRAASASAPRSGAALAAFIAGYLSLWGGFGAVALLQDVGIHRLVDRTPWLAAHPWLILGAALALAGGFQFSSLKERCLSVCRHPAAYLLRHYRRGVPGGFRLGWGHGIFCLGCCWALMLLMFAEGVANLTWMAALTTVMVYEKAGRRGDRVAPLVGFALLGLAAIVLAHPASLSQMLSSL
jgi:predicted metal-binding membrane protein